MHCTLGSENKQLVSTMYTPTIGCLSIMGQDWVELLINLMWRDVYMLQHDKSKRIYHIDVWPFAKACENTIYTVMIAVRIDTHTENLLNLTSMVEFQALLSSMGSHCLLQLQLPVLPSGKAHLDTDYTVVISILHWQYHTITVRKITLVVNFCSSSGHLANIYSTVEAVVTS